MCFGSGLGGGIAIFSEVNNFADEAGEDIEEASVFDGIFGKFLFEGRG